MSTMLNLGGRYRNTNESELEYTVGTMQYLPGKNIESGSNEKIPVVCIYKNDIIRIKTYTCFGISNGIVEQESCELSRATVTRYSEVQHENFGRFCQIVLATDIPSIPNTTHPCTTEVFALWVKNVMKNLGNNHCLHDNQLRG